MGGRLNNGYMFFTVLEAGILGTRCWCDWFLLRAEGEPYLGLSP